MFDNGRVDGGWWRVEMVELLLFFAVSFGANGL